MGGGGSGGERRVHGEHAKDISDNHPTTVTVRRPVQDRIGQRTAAGAGETAWLERLPLLEATGCIAPPYLRVPAGTT